MVSKIILSSLMTFIILFFVVLMNNFSFASIIYAAFLIYLFTRMTFANPKNKSKYRIIFQVVFAIFFCIAFIGDLYEERGSMAITASALGNSELPFCHIAIPQVMLPFIITKNIIFPARIAGHYASVASMICIWIAFTLILGRGWCSWACFYGGWEEGFSHVGKKRRINLLSKNKEIRNFQFAFFTFIVLVSLGEMASIYCEWFCPFKLVTEYSPMDSIPGLIAGVMFIVLFFGLVVVMPILSKRRTQCSMLCPFGAMASLTDKISLFKIKIDSEKCNGCLSCANNCPFGSIDIKTIKEKKGSPEITCAKCGKCVESCPQKAISFEFSFAKGCGKHKNAATKFGKIFEPLVQPENLFRFAAFSFGVVMSSSFVIKSINIIFNAIVKLF